VPVQRSTTDAGLRLPWVSVAVPAQQSSQEAVHDH